MTSNNHVIATAGVDDRLSLSKYLSGDVTVVQKDFTAGGVALIVESSGGSQYRLRTTADDDRLLMEKADGDGWEPFIRVDAARVESGPGNVITGP